MSKRNCFFAILFCVALLIAPANGLAQDTPNTRADPDAPAIDFLNPPQHIATGSWPQVLAGSYFYDDSPDDIAIVTARYFDEANDEQLHLFTSEATDGEEGPLTRTLTMTAGVAPAAIAAVDLNLDLRADVALALQGQAALAVYTQVTATLPITNPTGLTETNTLTGPLLLPLPAAANALAVGDFNDDLCVDLAAVVPGNDTIHLLQSTMEGPVLRQTTLAYPTDGYDALAAGDLDNDGDDDIAALRGSGYITESVVVYLQEQGAYPVSTVLTPTTGGYLPHSLSVGDVNNDGRDDLVVTAGGNTPDSFLNVFLQGTAGLTTTVITYTAFHLPGAVAVADLNHDGRDDVIVVNEAWRTLSLYSQTAEGKLAPYAVATLPYSSHYQPHGLSLADFDGNGGLDIALVGQEAGLTVITNSLSAPTSTILYPADAATLTPATVALPPGPVTISGTASSSAVTIEVRLRGGTEWITATLDGNTWQADLDLPNESRPWIIEARAIDADGHVQFPTARRRTRVTP